MKSPVYCKQWCVTYRYKHIHTPPVTFSLGFTPCIPPLWWKRRASERSQKGWSHLEQPFSRQLIRSLPLFTHRFGRATEYRPVCGLVGYQKNKSQQFQWAIHSSERRTTIPEINIVYFCWKEEWVKRWVTDKKLLQLKVGGLNLSSLELPTSW